MTRTTTRTPSKKAIPASRRPAAITATVATEKAEKPEPPTAKLRTVSPVSPVAPVIITDALSRLDIDPETSLARSLPLHLMSEHGCTDALNLSEEDAERLHVDLHSKLDVDHSVDDHRFRPGAAYDVMLSASAVHESNQRLLVQPLAQAGLG